MTELRKEDYGPEGDPSFHLPLAKLEAGLRALAEPPRDVGRLALLVVRRPDGTRETPASAQLTPQGGLAGDGWARRPPRDPEAQLAVMRHDVAALIANGQPLSTFGDNLFVELDSSSKNLPAGTRLRVGDAVVEVTAEPHDGCRKFLGRFGADALRFVQAKATRDRNLRGVYWKVCTGGRVELGEAIRVLGRG